MTPEGIWRVVCEDGRTHEVAVVPVTGGYSPWRAVCGPVGGSSYDRTPRAAVQSIVRMAAWVPLEILAPGERTREEAARALRMVTGERDEAARTVGRLMADGKALADEVERLRAQLAARPADDPEADGTDAAHPAWWRGQDAGCKGSLALVRRLRVEVDALKGEANITRDEVCALAAGVGVSEGDPVAMARGMANRIATLRVEVAELVANAEGQRALVELLDREAVDAASRYLAGRAEAVERAVAPLQEDARRWNARATELEEELERLRAVVAAVRREHDARAAWLASLPSGACSSPPPQALLDAEAATRAALQGVP